MPSRFDVSVYLCCAGRTGCLPFSFPIALCSFVDAVRSLTVEQMIYTRTIGEAFDNV